MQSERTIFNVPTRGILTEVLISRIRHSNFLLRDVNTSLDELKESIAQHGLLHPIIVRIVELGGDSNYEVVAGNRRFAACKQLGWRRIMCHILELNQQEAFEVSLIENLQHKTLNPVEEARAYKKYVEGRGWGSLSELSHKIGKSHSYVCNRIRLLELPNEVLDRIVRRQTNPGVVQEVLAIKDRHQRQMVVQEIVDNDLTRRQVRSLIYGRTEEDGLFECISNSCKPSKKEILLHEKEKIIFRFITTLRIALMRLDDSLEGMTQDDDWVLWQNLIHCRSEIHKQIDELVSLKLKTRLHFDRIEHVSSNFSSKTKLEEIGQVIEDSR